MTRSLLERKNTVQVQRLLNRFPVAIRSSKWPEMVAHIDAGRFADAVAMAQKMERRQQILQQNVVGRRMRIVRATLFKLVHDYELDLKQIFQEAQTEMVQAVERWAGDIKNVKKLQARSHEVAVKLRGRIRTWNRRLLWDGGIMGLKNSEAALMPIFQKNWESLREDRMSFDMDVDVANLNTPEVDVTSKKWTSKVDRIVSANEKSLAGGFTLSQRIFDLTDRAQKEIDRLVVGGIVEGKSPQSIARTIKKYLSPAVTFDEDGAAVLPKGAYYSPYKNAMRVARTEVIKVYTQTTAAYAQDKWWIKGVMITLSPAHGDADECDDWAGKVVSADEFAGLVPFHPHCMCYPTYVFDDSIMGDGDEREEE